MAYVLQQERGLLAMAVQQQAQLWDDRPFKRLRKVEEPIIATSQYSDSLMVFQRRHPGRRL